MSTQNNIHSGNLQQQIQLHQDQPQDPVQSIINHLKETQPWFEGDYDDIPQQEEDLNNDQITKIEYPWRKDYQNVCYASDLVITFPMSQDQQIQCQQARERYRSACLKSFQIDQKRIDKETLHYYPSDRSHPYFQKLLREVFQGLPITQFEKNQMRICSTDYLPFGALATFQFRNHKGTHNQIAMGHLTQLISSYKSTVPRSAISQIFGYRTSIPIRQSMERDRTGRVFQFARNILSIDPNPFTLTSNVSSLNRLSKGSFETTLGRYDQDDNLVMVHIKTSSVEGFHVHVTKKIYPTVYKCIDITEYQNKEEMDNGFLKIFTQYTNRDFTQLKANEKFAPFSPDHYGSINYYQPVKFKLPSLKDICHSVLKEKYLISREDTINTIMNLPFLTLQQFIKYCSNNDNSPSSFEIVNDIKMKWMELATSSSNQKQELELLNQLIPLDDWIRLIFSRDYFFYQSYIFGLPQSPFHPPYSEDLLINVYQQFDQFQLKQLPSDRILIASPEYISPSNRSSSSSSSSSSPTPSIVDKSTFINNFHQNTNNIFNNDKMNWNNIIIIGGIITSSLTGIKSGFEGSDIDVIIYGINDVDQQKAKITELYEYLGDHDQYTISSTDNVIAFSKHYPQRHIQVELKQYINIEQVLLGTDMDATCFAFDGSNLWTMQRGLESINYRCNFASSYGRNIRGDGIYQRRLLKYLSRGFSIANFTNDPFIIENFGQSTTPSLTQNPNHYYPSMIQNGIALLYSARDDPAVMKGLLAKNKRGSLPYGPEWNKTNFEKHIQENHDRNYDGYNSDLYPQIDNSFEEKLSSISLFREEIEVYNHLDWNYIIPKEPIVNGYYDDVDDAYDDDDDDDGEVMDTDSGSDSNDEGEDN